MVERGSHLALECFVLPPDVDPLRPRARTAHAARHSQPSAAAHKRTERPRPAHSTHSQPPLAATAAFYVYCVQYGVVRCTARARALARACVRARARVVRTSMEGRRAPAMRGGAVGTTSLSLWVSPLCKPLCTRPPPAPGAALSLPCVFWVCRHCACACAPYWRLMGATPCPRSTREARLARDRPRRRVHSISAVLKSPKAHAFNRACVSEGAPTINLSQIDGRGDHAKGPFDS